jgi:aspartate-semialdehyde dehydrogenase
MSEIVQSPYSLALVGASSLKGKEIKSMIEERHIRPHRLSLLDASDLQGNLTEFDDEPAIIQSVDKESFEGMTLAIFAASPEFTRDHWQLAESAGCDIIDVSYYLENNPRAMLVAPQIGAVLRKENQPGIGQADSPGIYIPAHPVSIAIAAILRSLTALGGVERSVVTVFEPVSEHGKAGVDELYNQTKNLLAFQKVPRTVFGSQVTFNLLTSYGPETRPTLQESARRISAHTAWILDGSAPPTSLRVLHAPAFYGYAFNCFVELKDAPSIDAIEQALNCKPFSLWLDPDNPPSVVDAAGSDDILVGHVEKDSACPTGFWIWGVLDNCRLPAIGAVEIAERLKHREEKQPSEGRESQRPAGESL